MTDREKQEVKKMWEQGMSGAAIARLLPYKEYISKREISQLKKEGFLKPRNVSDIRDATIIAEFEKNKNLLEIANTHGISIHYVRLILKRNKIAHPKTMNFLKNPPTDKVSAIMRDLENRVSQTEIANNYGVSRQYVFQIKQKMESDLI